MTGTEYCDRDPRVDWDAFGGPEIICSDGTVQKLNLLEILYFRIGILSAKELDIRYNNEPRKGW